MKGFISLEDDIPLCQSLHFLTVLVILFCSPIAQAPLSIVNKSPMVLLFTTVSQYIVSSAFDLNNVNL
jgi:hypothetical protein